MDSGDGPTGGGRTDNQIQRRYTGKLLGAVLHNGISREMRAARSKQSRFDELVAANRRKDETLAIVSHELRGPLATIKNALVLLGSRAADTAVHESARGMIERQVRQMTRLVDDLLPHVFDLFEQGSPADPRSAAGLGVGLAVVRDLVELHGGTVTAASAGTGRGSEFAVLLRTASAPASSNF
jgi:signal transduction histidine kinase